MNAANASRTYVGRTGQQGPAVPASSCVGPEFCPVVYCHLGPGHSGMGFGPQIVKTSPSRPALNPLIVPLSLGSRPFSRGVVLLTEHAVLLIRAGR